MLILTRKLGEAITIGDEIKVTVLGIYGRQVRLGVEAPQKVVVHREEVYLRIQEENRKAARSFKSDLLGLARIIKDKVKGDLPGEPSGARMRYKTSVPREPRRPKPPTQRRGPRRRDNGE